MASHRFEQTLTLLLAGEYIMGLERKVAARNQELERANRRIRHGGEILSGVSNALFG
jgi:hypothetical protein